VNISLALIKHYMNSCQESSLCFQVLLLSSVLTGDNWSFPVILPPNK
jgi:hypothetical protein